jgi:hypothetical protein
MSSYRTCPICGYRKVFVRARAPVVGRDTFLLVRAAITFMATQESPEKAVANLRACQEFVQACGSWDAAIEIIEKNREVLQPTT